MLHLLLFTVSMCPCALGLSVLLMVSNRRTVLSPQCLSLSVGQPCSVACSSGVSAWHHAVLSLLCGFLRHGLKQTAILGHCGWGTGPSLLLYTCYIPYYILFMLPSHL